MKTEDGNATILTKYDLMVASQSVTKNRFIRRFAKGMAKEISQFAEKNKLNGDLAIKLNNDLVASGEPPLSVKEKAWASSFCQIIPDLEDWCGQRIPTLLAKDYRTRFLENKNKKKKGDPKPIPPKAQPKAGRKTASK
jgi:hypothetical protein